MGALLGSLSALCIGLGDLFGRRVMAARGVIPTVAGLQAVAVLTSLATILLLGGEFDLSDVTLGALSGLGFGAGMTSYYSGLTRASSAIVSPLTATLSALVPFVYTAVTQELPTRLAFVGAAVAIMGLVLLTAGGARASNILGGVLWGLLAGASYGVGQTLVIEVSSESGAWPAVSQRLVAFVLIAVLATRSDATLIPPRGFRSRTAMAGVFAALSTVLFLGAVQFEATPAVVTASMFPAVTVTIGYLYFGDSVSRPQIVGIGAVLAGVALVVAG